MLHNVRTAIQRPNEQGEVHGKMATPLIYVASGNSIVSLLQSLPYSLTKKEFLLPSSIQKIMQPEILGTVQKFEMLNLVIVHYKDYNRL